MYRYVARSITWNVANVVCHIACCYIYVARYIMPNSTSFIAPPTCYHDCHTCRHAYPVSPSTLTFAQPSSNAGCSLRRLLSAFISQLRRLLAQNVLELPHAVAVIVAEGHVGAAPHRLLAATHVLPRQDMSPGLQSARGGLQVLGGHAVVEPPHHRLLLAQDAGVESQACMSPSSQHNK
jgi:hypothetical protein